MAALLFSWRRFSLLSWRQSEAFKKSKSKEASCGKQQVVNELAKRNTGLKQNVIALLEAPGLNFVLGARDKGANAGF